MNRKFIAKTLLIPTLTVMSLTSCSVTENTCTVRWTNYDGSEILVEKYKKGETPAYKLDPPTRPSEGAVVYTFTGWSPGVAAVTTDTTYIAQYSAIVQDKFTVTWKNYNGDVLFTETDVPYGANPKYPGTALPTRPMTSGAYYVFKGWTPEFTPVKDNVEYTAEYYEITGTTDHDYDGMPDCIDPDPENNVFNGVTLNSMNPMASDLTIDYRLLTNGNNEVYNKDLAKLGVYLSNRSCDFHDGMFSPEKMGGAVNALYTRLGCDDIYDIDMQPADFDVDEHDVAGASLAHHVVEEDDKKTDVIFMSIQGTRGSPNMDEWISNFDVGSTGGVYNAVTGDHPEWIDKSFHKGFEVVTERYLANNKVMGAKEYVDNHCQNSDPVLFICGHSRGGACANILGDYFTHEYKTPYGGSCKVFTYTYAAPAPRDIEGARSVESTFNIVNGDDLVPMLPLKQWGMDRIGPAGQVDYITDAISEKYSGQYKIATGKDYTHLVGIKDVLAKLTAQRNDLYDPAMTEVNESWTHQGYATKEEAEAKQAEIISDIESVVQISPKYFNFNITEEPRAITEYDLHIYNCVGALFAIVNNIFMHKYPDLSVLYPYVSLISNPRYIEAALGFIEAGVVDPNTVGYPHDLSSYLVIVDNHE